MAEQPSERFQSQLRDVSRRLDPALLAELRSAHEEYGWCCVARNEGQECCLEWLTDPPDEADLSAVGGAEGHLKSATERSSDPVTNQ